VISIIQYVTTLLASILVLVLQFLPAGSVVHTGRQMARRIVLHEVSVPFDPGHVSHVAVALFLRETSSLMDQPSLMQEGWFERLSERGLVRAAALSAENPPVVVGESHGTGTGIWRGYHVEAGFIALSDGIVTGSSPETSGDDLMVISRYPFWGESWQVIALIVILPGAIFLLVYAIRYRRYDQKPEVRGALSMATKKESDDVISEIDREISDLIDEEVAESGAAALGKVRSDNTEKKPVRKVSTTASAETPAEAAATDEAVLKEVQRAVKKEEGEHSSLEKDGIIIRKG
jgi:hypothetical protein